MNENDLAARAALMNEQNGGSSFAGEDDWPEPIQLQSELPPVPPFGESLLPEPLRPLVVDIADRMQVPMDYPAVITMLSLAGAVNRRAVIQPKKIDSGWTEPANLWGGIVGPPGIMKSPVIHACTNPLVRIQTGWRAEYQDAFKGTKRLPYAAPAFLLKLP
jgi:hypothetical protein